MQVAAIFKTCPVCSPSQADSLQSHTIILREETHTYADLISLLKGQFKKKKNQALGVWPLSISGCAAKCIKLHKWSATVNQAEK